MAHQHRGSLLLAELIAELDPLFAVGLRNGPGLVERINQVAETLAWSTSGNPYPLAAAAWQARLTAAGWPVPSPGPHTSRWDAPNASGPLPASLVNLAQEELRLHLGVDDPIWPAALLITLWASAVSSVQAGDLDQPARLRGLLAHIMEEHDEAHAGEPAVTDVSVGQDPLTGVRPLDLQLRRLTGAAMRWVEAAEAGRSSAVVPRARGARRLPDVIRKLLATPGFADWSYHGFRVDDEALVVVEEPDGSRRLLRDTEARARGEFEWGYSGGGPYSLGVALTTDALADLARCPDCFGAGPCGAGLVVCKSCHETGLRPEQYGMPAALRERLISRLPNLPEAIATLSGAEWSLTRSEVLRSAFQRQQPDPSS